MKLTNEFTYLRRNPAVQAVWWNGDNRDEVIRFFRDCGLPEDQGPYFAEEGRDDDFPVASREDDYNIVQFYWNDDEEVDEKRWIVFDHGDYGFWSAEDFHEVINADLMS